MTASHRIKLFFLIGISYPLAALLAVWWLIVPIVGHIAKVIWTALNFPHHTRNHFLIKWGYMERPKTPWERLKERLEEIENEAENEDNTPEKD